MFRIVKARKAIKEVIHDHRIRLFVPYVESLKEIDWWQQIRLVSSCSSLCKAQTEGVSLAFYRLLGFEQPEPKSYHNAPSLISRFRTLEELVA